MKEKLLFNVIKIFAIYLKIFIRLFPVQDVGYNSFGILHKV